MCVCVCVCVCVRVCVCVCVWERDGISPKNNKELFIDMYNHITTLMFCLCSSVVRINKIYDVYVICGFVLYYF